MELTVEKMVEEYHLPTGNPIQLEKRLRELTESMRRMYGSPATSSELEAKIKFLEGWKNNIASLSEPKPMPTGPRGRRYF